MVAVTAAFLSGATGTTIGAGASAAAVSAGTVSATSLATAASYGAAVGTAAGYGSTALSLLGSYSTAQAQIQAGEQAAQGYKEQAAQEALRAGEEANLRRDRLLKALSAQTAQAGASGVAGATIEALQMESTEEYKKEQKAADIYSKNVQSSYQRQAGAAQRIGKAKATGSLLSTATQLADIG